jgi:hypothetical protein
MTMTDDLVKRLRAIDHLSVEDCFCQSALYDQAADLIEALQAQNFRLSSLCDDLKYEVAVDNALLIGEAEASLERLARAEKAEAERDKAYARGYSDAETEISKSALGQGNAFLHSQYANAADRISALTAERDQARAMVAEADTRLGQALGEAIQDKADNARLREALDAISVAKPGDDPALVLGQVVKIALFALKGESHE